MSVPLYWSDDDLPIGVHFLGRFGDEATLLRLASQLDRPVRRHTDARPVRTPRNAHSGYMRNAVISIKRITTGRQLMFTVDPDGHETRALHSLVEFSDKDVIEIGAGDGRMTWRYADAARSVIALDPRESDIELATRATPEHLRERVRFLAVDATTYRYAEGRFDVAVLSHSLC